MSPARNRVTPMGDIEALPLRRGPPAEARALYSELTSEAGQA